MWRDAEGDARNGKDVGKGPPHRAVVFGCCEGRKQDKACREGAESRPLHPVADCRLFLIVGDGRRARQP